MKKKVILIICILILSVIIATIIIIKNGKQPLYSNPTIPEGFKKINASNQDVNNGLVIEDELGNQFVWIPVDGENIKLTRKNFTSEEIVDIKQGEQIEKIYYSEEHINSSLSNYIEDAEKEQYSIEAFKQSVYKYGGFYIARYETGKDEQGNIVVKSGMLPYTNLTRDEALENSVKMYANNNSIVSSLINSYAWDTALAFINQNQKKYYDNKEYTGTGVLQKTGETQDVACNIFDLSGNVKEWSTEYSSNGYYSYLSSCVVRGGYYNNSKFSAASRYYNGEDAKNEYIGYRMILYFK